MDILVIDGVALPTPNEYKRCSSPTWIAAAPAAPKMEFWCASGTRRRGENQRQLGRIEHSGLRQGAERHRPGQYAGGLLFGGTRTAKMYAGDRTADLKAAREGRAVWEVAVNLIE